MANSDFSRFRRFRLWRESDVNGNSGIGFVAEGTQYSCGKVVVSFYKDLIGVANMEIFDNIDEAIKIHGHEGKTKVVWCD